MTSLKSLVIILFFCPQFSIANCAKWFDKTGLSGEKDCLLKCLSSDVDMSTFTCKDQCEKFCNDKSKSNNSENLYGLTDDELALVKKYPSDMSKAYLLSWKTEAYCGELYKVSDTNDESDACRHFIWAAFLTESLGRDRAEEVLNAHENNPLQDENEKSMDLAKNRRGVSVAEKLIKSKVFTKENIMNEFKDELKKKNLIILKRDKND